MTREVVDQHNLMTYYSKLVDPFWATHRKDAELPTEAEARGLISTRATVLNRNGIRNSFTGEPFREEDSPGNHQLILEKDRLVLYMYDANGALTHVGSAHIKTGTLPAP